MEMLFAVCAVAGGMIMLCQFALTLLGLGGHHDFGGDHHVDFSTHGGDSGQTDHGSAWFLGLLSFRSLVAAITFFGLSGLAASSSQAVGVLALPIALFSGLAAMLLVAWLMGVLSSLKDEGTVRIENAMGATGIVYLTVPQHGGGTGKVTIKIQHRTVEYEAVTSAAEPLATGTPIAVVGVVGPNTVEVWTLPE